MNYIHLKHYHTKTSRFTHPLTDVASPLDIEALNIEAELVVNGKSPDELITSLIRCVGLLVSRYLGNFPQARKLTDEMVGEGILAITAVCQNIPTDLLEERGILKIAESRAQNAIETMLNEMMAVSAPSARQQRYLLELDKDPIYLQAETNCYDEGMQHVEDTGDEWKRDVLDALEMIQPQDDIDAVLLNPLNWGRNYQEIADELGVGVGTIHRKKAQLYDKYKELTS